ncbi:MAG: hypothetical protein KKE89_03530 [Actinobacteria bacterium]|nr:hypothetical protein [Actinomycetota bacterium]
MYWLQRPPYLRWAAAALLVIGAAMWDLRPEPTTLHPYLITDVSAGDPIEDGDIEWRRVPAGLIAAPDLSAPIAATDLNSGQPLCDAMLRKPAVVPPGWWSVPVTVGSHAGAGDEVLLVVVDPPTTVVGIVVTPQRGDPYSLNYRPASVAVPAASAPLIAASSSSGTLVAAVRPASGERQGQ